MKAFRRFEERLEQLVSGAFARAFRSNVQPVELASALQREADNSAQVLSRNRRLVPNSFSVELSAADHDRLAPYGSALVQELTDVLRQHASDQSYVFTGPVDIFLERAEDLTTGRFRVRSAAVAAVAGGEPVDDLRPVSAQEVFVEVNGTRHRVPTDGLVVGRGSDADLRVNDPGISRRHAHIRLRPEHAGGGVDFIDLGSTNGIVVDGERRDHVAVPDGGRVLLGTTTVVVRGGHGPGTHGQGGPGHV